MEFAIHGAPGTHPVGTKGRLCSSKTWLYLICRNSALDLGVGIQLAHGLGRGLLSGGSNVEGSVGAQASESRTGESAALGSEVVLEQRLKLRPRGGGGGVLWRHLCLAGGVGAACHQEGRLRC